MKHGSEPTLLKSVCLYDEQPESRLIGPAGISYNPILKTVPIQLKWIPTVFIHESNWDGLMSVSDIKIPAWLARTINT